MRSDDMCHNSIARIHQIWLTDDHRSAATLPPTLEDNTAVLRTLHPDADYQLWNFASLREMISKNFEPKVIHAFDLLTPYSYKADLARFCLLHLYGGLYVDVAIRFIAALSVPRDAGVASFRDYEFVSCSWTTISTSIIWSVPQRREFEIAINYILENCQKKYYGSNPLYPTGPVVLGRALIAVMAERKQQDDADDQWIGLCRAITPDAPRKNIAYVTPDQAVVALRAKDRGGDLTHLGAVGTNNYNILWRRRMAYGETVSVWTFNDPDIRLTDGAQRTAAGIIAKPGAAGMLTYGPYIEMDAGAYRLSILFGRAAPLPKMVVEVVFNVGNDLLHVHEQDEDNLTITERMSFRFHVPMDISSVEFRTWVFGDLAMEIREIRLERLG